MIGIEQVPLINQSVCITSDTLREALKPYKLLKIEDYQVCSNYLANHLSITDGLIMGFIGLLLGSALTFYFKWIFRKQKE
jgi:hypothetical protein